MNYNELTNAIANATGIPLHVFNIDKEPKNLKHDGTGLYSSPIEINYTGINCRYQFIKDIVRLWKGIHLEIEKSYTLIFINLLNEIFKENQLETIEIKPGITEYRYSDNGFLLLLVRFDGSEILLDFARPL